MYYKGTEEECNGYNNLVSLTFLGVTTSWSVVVNINGCFYIDKHNDFSSDMELVNEITPIQNNDN